MENDEHSMKLLLFDIDSTLLRDGGASGRAYDQAFRESFGILPVTIEKYGKTDPNITREIVLATMGRVISPEEERRLHERYLELVPGYLATSSGFMVLPGAEALLRKLCSDPSCALGIQTGNFETSAMAKLYCAHLDAYFHFGGYGSDASDRGSLVNKAIERGNAFTGCTCSGRHVVVIGDSPSDIIAGKLNGTVAIGVTTGKNTMTELTAAGADAVVSDLSAVMRILEMLDNRH